MRVTLEQSGGFAGLMITKAINAQELSPSETQELEQLVKDSNFFQLTSISEASPQPDRFGYTLSVEMNGLTHSIELSETNMPEKARSLIEWVQAH
ncbi:MAG: hypothetical protein KME10_18045 [Plectolyngbya sp. WJT66-NPBG17]|jgi:hypothetical protein|nr:hypothetical protein [Plectolyngbya sp. WJT66-NPBG17]MBW4525118.1 hypothetical protein [Phormidium tanganyikae FI6-MK23]